MVGNDLDQLLFQNFCVFTEGLLEQRSDHLELNWHFFLIAGGMVHFSRDITTQPCSILMLHLAMFSFILLMGKGITSQ